MKCTVAIPTYKRPEFLKKAVVSIMAQVPLPDEILLVSRYDDEATNLAIKNLIVKYKKVSIKNPQVIEAGFLPPVRKAVEMAAYDIFILMDDDAEAHPGWLARILTHYSDSNIAGVGGRCVNYFSGVLQNYPAVSTVAKLFWYGRSVGNMYRDCSFIGAIDADFLIGGNMSYRTSILRECMPDDRIGNNVAFHWEMDVGAQVKKIGKRIIFDPTIIVDHHTAPREIEGMRTANYKGTYWSNYNYALLMHKHLTKVGFLAYLLHTFIVGGSGAPGLVYLVYRLLHGRPLDWKNTIVASFKGRWAGIWA